MNTKKRILEGELHAPPERERERERERYVADGIRIRGPVRFNFAFRSTHSSPRSAVSIKEWRGTRGMAKSRTFTNVVLRRIWIESEI